MSALVDMYQEFLEREGFRPEVDEEGDVAFKYEGQTLWVMVDEEDQHYFRILLSYFWEIETDEERTRAYRCASEATRRFKVAKVYVTRDGDNVCAATEQFINPIAGYQTVFLRCCSAVTAAAGLFARLMRGEEE